MHKQMSDIESLKFELENLEKLHADLEKQMIRLDEIIPYERQTTAKIFSPRLLNMMLACGPQIESITKLIAKRSNMDLNEIIDDSGSKKSKSIPSLIHEINSKTVLSGFAIVSKLHKLLFTPFTLHLEWWGKYNDLKHGLSSNQFEINYTVVMDSLAALAALHYLADKLMACFDEDIPKVLDSKNWKSYDEMITISPFVGHKPKPFWESLLFEIKNDYNPSGVITH